MTLIYILMEEYVPDWVTMLAIIPMCVWAIGLCIRNMRDEWRKYEASH